MRVVGYIRISSAERARDGYGLANQEHDIRQYCERQRWDLIEIYSDAGISGKSIKNRHALLSLLSAAESRSFDRVVVWKIDRFGRNLLDSLVLYDKLSSYGIDVASATQQFDSSTASGRAFRNNMMVWAEYERELISERIKAGYAQKAREGKLIGPIPLGYKRVDGKVEVDPVTAPLVAEMFSRYSAGDISLREMAEWAASVSLKSTEGNPLDRLSIRKILVNPAYIGKVAMHLRSGGGIVSDAVHPAIVDIATFARVQEMLVSRQRSYTPKLFFGKQPYPLTGTTYCAHNMHSLLGVRATKRQLRYMRCSPTNRQGKDACSQPMVRAEILEAQIGAYVSTMRLPPDYLGEVVQELRSRRRPGPTTDKSQLERQLERWRRLFVLGEIDEAYYKKEAAPIRKKLAEVSRPEEVLDIEKAVYLLRDVGRAWMENPMDTQREFVQATFERIVVEGPQVISITPKTTFAPLFALDRIERFEGRGGVTWLPDEVSSKHYYTPVINSKTGRPFAVPALILPDHMMEGVLR